jgi:hypothetical protein
MVVGEFAEDGGNSNPFFRFLRKYRSNRYQLPYFQLNRVTGTD